MQLWNFSRYRQPRGRSTPAPGTILNRLDDDVLVGILCFCGIPEILASSESCRHFYNLAFSQQVWLAIVRDLHARLFLDLPEDWNPTLLSTPSLVDLAKRAVCGPTSWSPRSQLGARHQALSLVRRAGQVVRGQRPKHMPSKIVSSYHIPYLVDHPRSSRLLPGGKYVLLSGTRFMCWSLVQNECVWEYAPKYQNSWFHEFEATMVGDGKAAVILISGLTQTPSIMFIDAVRLDLTTKTSQLLLHLIARAPIRYFGDHFLNLKVCSDIAVARCGHNQILVMNLATASHVLLRGERHPTIRNVDCIPGHIIVAIDAQSFRSVSNGTFMHIWDINTWPSSYWSYGSSELTQSWKILPKPLVTEAISLPEGFNSGAAILSTHVSPLCPQTYTIWAEVCALGQRRQRSHHIVTKYQLTPDPTTHQVSLDYISSSSQKLKTRDNQSLFVGGISFAGHTRLIRYAPTTRQHIVACGQPSVVRADEIPLDIPSHSLLDIRMSPYSGALTISGVDGVFVYYYE